MEKVVLKCEGCGKSYDVSKLQPGRRFACKGCEAELVVPDPAAAEAEERPGVTPARVRRVGTNVGHDTRRKPLPQDGPEPDGPPSAVGAGHGSSYRNSPAKTGRRGTPIKKLDTQAKSPMLFWVGVGVAVVVVGVALFFLFGKKGNGEQTGTAGTGNTQAAAQQAPPQPPPPQPGDVEKKRFAELEEKARAGDAKAVEAAIAYGTEQKEYIAEGRVRDLYRRWLELDPQSQKANEYFGNKLWEPTSTWVSEAEFAKLEKEAARAKDPFVIAAKQIIASELTDAVGSVTTKFDYYYDDPELVPRPYVLAVENDGITSTDIVAKEVGKNSLFVLYTMFRDEYEGLFKLPPIDKPVPVYVFMGKKGYDLWRNDGRDHLPPSEQVLGFYSSSWQSQGRGVLHVWRFQDGMNPMPVYFHEGTHQLMDYYGPRMVFGSREGKTPWFQEGIAEYWGGVVRVRDGAQWKYLIGQPNDSRMGTCRKWAEADEGRMSIKELLALDYPTFELAKIKREKEKDARSGLIVENNYALGWVIIDYCFNNLGDESMRDAMRKYMKHEIEGTGGGDVLAKLLNLNTDEEYEIFEIELGEYIIGELSKRWRRN